MSWISCACDECGRPTGYYGSWDAPIRIICKDCAQAQRKEETFSLWLTSDARTDELLAISRTDESLQLALDKITVSTTNVKVLVDEKQLYELYSRCKNQEIEL